MAAASLLSRLCAQAMEEWPALNFVPRAELEAFITARIPLEKLDPDVRAGDLLLAHACMKGSRVAQDLLHELTEEEIELVYNRIRPPVGLKHAQQIVYSRLFTKPDGGVPRIALYRGDIDLVGYVRNAASRELLAFSSKTTAKALSIEDLILKMPDGVPLDPQLDRIKRNYLAGVRIAITHTVSALEPRDRALLGYAILEQLGADALALMYEVDRETMIKKLHTARERFEFRLKHRLAEALRMPQRDHVTLVGFLSTQLDRLFDTLYPRGEFPTLIDGL